MTMPWPSIAGRGKGEGVSPLHDYMNQLHNGFSLPWSLPPGQKSLALQLWETGKEMSMDGASAFVVFVVVLCFVIGVLFCMIPWFIARGRHMESTGALLVVSLLFGWTLIGWLACLLWAVLGQTKQQRRFYEAAMESHSRETVARARPGGRIEPHI
jgi:hypothetical protein